MNNEKQAFAAFLLDETMIQIYKQAWWMTASGLWGQMNTNMQMLTRIENKNNTNNPTKGG